MAPHDHPSDAALAEFMERVRACVAAHGWQEQRVAPGTGEGAAGATEAQQGSGRRARSKRRVSVKSKNAARA